MAMRIEKRYCFLKKMYLAVWLKEGNSIDLRFHLQLRWVALGWTQLTQLCLMVLGILRTPQLKPYLWQDVHCPSIQKLYCYNVGWQVINVHNFPHWARDAREEEKCKFLGEHRSIVLRETEGETSPGGKSTCWQMLNLLRGVFDFFHFYS